MAYDIALANRVREYLAGIADIVVVEQEMFKGLTFMVNGKMCVSVSGDELMVRYEPALQDSLAELVGYRQMTMKNRVYKGYGYVAPEVIKSNQQFAYWMDLCLNYNPKAKASKKR